MKRAFTLTLDDVEYTVEVEGDKVTIDGCPFAVEITDDAVGDTGTVLVDGIAYDVALEGERAMVDGESYGMQVDGLAMSTAAAAPVSSPVAVPSTEVGPGAVLAIMPGKVIRVMVEPGQEVQEGDSVCVLEAMKMENELLARRDGTVRSVYVEPGDDVEKDQVLVEIE